MFHFYSSPLAMPQMRQTGGNEGELRHISGNASPAYWSKRTPGLPLLINGTGIYEYGALHFSYALDAYAIEYGALHFSYILGGIVEASIDTAVAATGGMSALGVYESLVAASTAAATSLASTGKTLDGSIDAAVAVTGTMAVSATIHALMESAVEAVFFVRIAGETFPAWAVNLSSFAPTRYENYNFNSFAKIGGLDLAASTDGLYELGGDDDDGTQIDASIMLGRDQRGSGQVKRSRRVYLHGTSGDKLEVRVVDEAGEIHAYKTELSLSDTVGVQRVVLGRGLTANYWQLEVRNTNGGDFAIEQIEIVSMHTDRKVRRRG